MTRADDPAASNLSPRELGRATILIAAICFMVLAAIGFSVAEIRIKILEQAEAGFRLDAHVQVSDVQAALTAAASAAETAGRFSATAEGINPIGFSGFLGGITVQYPWIAAIEWVPKIDHARRRSFIEVARRVLPGYQIRETNAKGTLVPAGLRPVYFPVTVVEPLSLESLVVGLDVGATAEIRNVLDGASETGELRASEILARAREVGKGPSVILAAPVYNDVPVGGGGASPVAPRKYSGLRTCRRRSAACARPRHGAISRGRAHH